MSATMEKVDHARQNAQGWAQSIAAMVAAMECDYDRLEELRDERASLVQDNESAAGEGAEEEGKARDALNEWDEENGEELKELADAANLEEGYPCTNQDDARERIQESPLSVQVRSGWYSPGETEQPAEEFEILLTTGGPALRIRGELDRGQPCRAWLEYQDWGTGWQEYHGEGCENSTLLTFCQCFYFGD